MGARPIEGDLGALDRLRVVHTQGEEAARVATINGWLLHYKVTGGHEFTVTSRYDNSQPCQDVLTYVWWGT